eukprot:5411964-Prorocentrum_lima.AAC.1
MTSSLVGSEMCIRDRNTSCSPLEQPLWWHDGGWDNARTVGIAAPHDNGAVSYTHLTLPTICSV